MVDVEATLVLAQRFLQNVKWDYVTGYFNKRTDQERTQESFPEGSWFMAKLVLLIIINVPCYFRRSSSLQIKRAGCA